MNLFLGLITLTAAVHYSHQSLSYTRNRYGGATNTNNQQQQQQPQSMLSNLYASFTRQIQEVSQNPAPLPVRNNRYRYRSYRRPQKPQTQLVDSLINPVGGPGSLLIPDHHGTVGLPSPVVDVRNPPILVAGHEAPSVPVHPIHPVLPEHPVQPVDPAAVPPHPVETDPRCAEMCQNNIAPERCQCAEHLCERQQCHGVEVCSLVRDRGMVEALCLPVDAVIGQTAGQNHGIHHTTDHHKAPTVSHGTGVVDHIGPIGVTHAVVGGHSHHGGSAETDPQCVEMCQTNIAPEKCHCAEHLCDTQPCHDPGVSCRLVRERGMVEAVCLPVDAVTGQAAGQNHGIHHTTGCGLPMDEGRPCGGASTTEYYFDVMTQMCTTFIYNGCGGNDNRFKTLHECNGTCSQRHISPGIIDHHNAPTVSHGTGVADHIEPIGTPITDHHGTVGLPSPVVDVRNPPILVAGHEAPSVPVHPIHPVLPEHPVQPVDPAAVPPHPVETDPRCAEMCQNNIAPERCQCAEHLCERQQCHGVEVCSLVRDRGMVEALCLPVDAVIGQTAGQNHGIHHTTDHHKAPTVSHGTGVVDHIGPIGVTHAVVGGHSHHGGPAETDPQCVEMCQTNIAPEKCHCAEHLCDTQPCHDPGVSCRLVRERGMVEAVCLPVDAVTGQAAGQNHGIHHTTGCGLPMDEGRPCGGASTTEYYFDVMTQMCTTFIYNGCGGNDNRFKTLHECNGTCSQRHISPGIIDHHNAPTVSHGTGVADHIEPIGTPITDPLPKPEPTVLVDGGGSPPGVPAENDPQCVEMCQTNIAPEKCHCAEHLCDRHQCHDVGVSCRLVRERGMVEASCVPVDAVTGQAAGQNHGTHHTTVGVVKSSPPLPASNTDASDCTLLCTKSLVPERCHCSDYLCDHKTCEGNNVCKLMRSGGLAEAMCIKPTSVPDSTSRRPSNACGLPKDIGSCLRRRRRRRREGIRYYFDAETQSCETFTFSGCRGNANRFMTRGRCEKFCLETRITDGVQRENPSQSGLADTSGTYVINKRYGRGPRLTRILGSGGRGHTTLITTGSNIFQSPVGRTRQRVSGLQGLFQPLISSLFGRQSYQRRERPNYRRTTKTGTKDRSYSNP